MIERDAQKDVEKLLRQFPAVVIGGARQIGKTTLARALAKRRGQKALLLDMELPSDRRKMDDMETLFTRHADKLIVIDEAQTLPEIFTVLRPLIDADRRPGRFLLLGSVSPFLMSRVSQTLAGRVAHAELSGVNLREIAHTGITFRQLWFKGGYPPALTLRHYEKWRLWMYNYEKTFVERDVTMLMNETLSPATVRRLWLMLSGLSGHLLNYEDLSRSLGISRATVIKYTDFLEGAYLIRRLQPWFINTAKRLVKSPKIYFRDSGLLHFMNRIYNPDDLANHHTVGASWEGFVIEQIIRTMPVYLSPFFYRTHQGAEADLVLVKGNRPVAAIEVKLNNQPDVPKGFRIAADDLQTKYAYIITPESDDYTLKGVRVCSLMTFVCKYLPAIARG
ncbi:MAG: ATP-binding protein [Chitinophagales bacterium]|nr:ATP-binding protein [Chitinophagales bacterium]